MIDTTFGICPHCKHYWMQHSSLLGCMEIISRGGMFFGPQLCECPAVPPRDGVAA